MDRVGRVLRDTGEPGEGDETARVVCGFIPSRPSRLHQTASAINSQRGDLIVSAADLAALCIPQRIALLHTAHLLCGAMASAPAVRTRLASQLAGWLQTWTAAVRAVDAWFGTQRWLLSYAWFSFSGGRPWCEWSMRVDLAYCLRFQEQE